MKISDIKIINSVLSKEIGWLWPIFFIKCLIKKKSIFKKTHWTNLKEAEAKFVKRISIISAIFLNLKEKVNKEKAFEITKSILVPMGCHEQKKHLQSLKLSNEKPMEKLMAFHNLMDKKGAPQFNTREYLKQDENICHFIITRCVFHDFFREAGTPELTKLFCEVDKEFFPNAFFEFKFHRGNSWKNTIGYEQNHCEFIFEKKT